MGKKLLSMLLAISMLFAVIGGAACGNTDSSSDNTGSGSTSTSTSSSSSGNGGDDLEINLGDKDNPTYAFVEDGNLQASTVNKNDSIYKLQATDDFGRSLDFIYGYKTDKKRYVGLMYFLWLGWHGGEMPDVYDNTKLLNENPDALWDKNGTAESPTGKYHHWGEPMYGYYHSKDPWIIRKHLELFTMSGIDFLCFDCTNGFEYMDVVDVLLPIMQEMYDEGWNVPKFMFYTNSNSAETVKRIYKGQVTATPNEMINKGIYKGGYYRDLWFAPNGKPKIAAIIDKNHNFSESNRENSVITDPEILNFFDFWESQWPNNVFVDKGLPWMDWGRPQTVHTDTINVSVAQHNLLPFSDALLSEAVADGMYGRGYHNGAPDHSDDAINRADNFNEEWEVALEADVPYTLVTGWNEWVAIKSVGAPNANVSGSRVFFVDSFNKEYSRDVEMMKGGYQDNYYLSMMRNIRELKGDKSKTLAKSAQANIDITKGLTQWNEIKDVYYGIKTVNRNYTDYTNMGASNPAHQLVDNSLRNDIEEVRVTHDSENIYFMVKCFNDIAVDAEGKNWMNILIDVEGYQNADAFYGYDFVVNRLSSYTGECGVEKIKYDFFEETLSYAMTAKANFTVHGKYMQYKIPKSALGITGEFKINFKIADNVTEPDNIESYYTTGDCAPVGRLNWTFKG